MKKVETIAENKNYTAVSIGSLDKLMEYSYLHPRTKKETVGKVFVQDETKATGTEISFQIIPPKSELPYFHIHYQNEETYIILKGSGDFQIDGDCFPISEGSVIRIAPAGARGMRNSSDEPMICMVVQSKEGSLEQRTFVDGEIIVWKPKWK
jgi:mannose-6-phosphate isomerase-like protein (cupin superfamily)